VTKTSGLKEKQSVYFLFVCL